MIYSRFFYDARAHAPHHPEHYHPRLELLSEQCPQTPCVSTDRCVSVDRIHLHVVSRSVLGVDQRRCLGVEHIRCPFPVGSTRVSMRVRQPARSQESNPRMSCFLCTSLPLIRSRMHSICLCCSAAVWAIYSRDGDVVGWDGASASSFVCARGAVDAGRVVQR